MASMPVTLKDVEGHSGLFKRNSSTICVAFYKISTERVLARFICVS